MTPPTPPAAETPPELLARWSGVMSVAPNGGFVSMSDYLTFKEWATRTIAAERARADAAERKSDKEMERVKACEHIAEGDEGWEVLRELCPSTSAVARLRDEYAFQARNHLKAQASMLEQGKELTAAEARAAELERVLEELVALKDMKDTFERVKADESFEGDSITLAGDLILNGMAKEYQRRKPLAWEAARAVLRRPA